VIGDLEMPSIEVGRRMELTSESLFDLGVDYSLLDLGYSSDRTGGGRMT
jgi:hypothetical protein